MHATVKTARPHYSIRLVLSTPRVCFERLTVRRVRGLLYGVLPSDQVGRVPAGRAVGGGESSVEVGRASGSLPLSLEILFARRPTGREARERSCFGDSAPLFPFRAFVVLVLFSCEVKL